MGSRLYVLVSSTYRRHTHLFLWVWHSFYADVFVQMLEDARSGPLLSPAGADGSGNGSGIEINAACDTEDPADNYGDNDLVRGVPHFGCNTDGEVTATSETVNNADGSYTVITTSVGRTETVTYYPDGRTTMMVSQAAAANGGGGTTTLTSGTTAAAPTMPTPTAGGGGGGTGGTGGGGGY